MWQGDFAFEISGRAGWWQSIVQGGTPEAEATLRGQLLIMRMKGRQAIVGTRCMLYSVYAILGECYTRCMLYWVYAILGVCYTRCMLYSVYAVLSVCYTWCMLYLVYAILSVCYTRCMLYSVYAELSVSCTQCMVYSVSTHDHDMER